MRFLLWYKIRGDVMSNEAMLEELREIRKLLTPPPKPEPPKGLVNEFVDFISQYKVLGLAVAFILGIYIGNIVTALVNSIIMPLVEIVYPPIDPLNELYEFTVGPLMDSLITFVIVAFVIFIIVKVANRIGIE
jgi:large conductance mechanosensitive channel